MSDVDPAFRLSAQVTAARTAAREALGSMEEWLRANASEAALRRSCFSLSFFFASFLGLLKLVDPLLLGFWENKIKSGA